VARGAPGSRSTPVGTTISVSDHEPGDPAVQQSRRIALNEDWAATVVGLLLLGLVLTGLLPGWLVP
jgi:hypothetical protein